MLHINQRQKLRSESVGSMEVHKVFVPSVSYRAFRLPLPANDNFPENPDLPPAAQMALRIAA